MLAIVKLGLRRPYTFVVLAILILLIGPLASLRTPTDIFPDIKIPVIAVVWTYRGLPPDDMAGRVIYYYERQLSSSVNDIEHIESQSLSGIGIVKIFFRPGVDIRTATAQVSSVAQNAIRMMPAGTQPPLVLNFSASTVPRRRASSAPRAASAAPSSAAPVAASPPPATPNERSCDSSCTRVSGECRACRARASASCCRRS